VRERGGTPFRQIFWSRNGAPANTVGHRWKDNTEAFRQITLYSFGWPSISLFSGPNAGFGIKNLKKIIRGCQREEASPSCTHPQHGYMPWPCTGAQAPSLLGPRSRKPFPQIKIYHYTPGGILHKMSNWQMKKWLRAIFARWLQSSEMLPVLSLLTGQQEGHPAGKTCSSLQNFSSFKQRHDT